MTEKKPIVIDSSSGESDDEVEVLDISNADISYGFDHSEDYSKVLQSCDQASMLPNENELFDTEDWQLLPSQHSPKCDDTRPLQTPKPTPNKLTPPAPPELGPAKERTNSTKTTKRREIGTTDEDADRLNELKVRLEKESDKSIHDQLSQFGFKIPKSRKQRIKLLSQCLYALENTKPEPNGKERQANTKANDEAPKFEDIIAQTSNAITAIVRSAPGESVWSDMLAYIPVQLDALQSWLKKHNLNVSTDLLRNWCDAQGVLVAGSWDVRHGKRNGYV
ncbi:structure-specific endonuclease subunit [Schizosaccharomyces japonicus yFS275]|uniref:Structure-specific endonuclease subunit SLX4 n=1 Tax=Schizosaccharomyces japonicus (strain yFS275 / FY16936) TaxID=402676 RepID=B6JXL6_SCHJY|nr:structure-specific endonuclease subunit [Schizosaccharomyces japonicus yFS275]EEB05160.1 structure-specific endonuclease subunit [Schizosaccharomyces japonicus yFS275]